MTTRVDINAAIDLLSDLPATTRDACALELKAVLKAFPDSTAPAAIVAAVESFVHENSHRMGATSRLAASMLTGKQPATVDHGAVFRQNAGVPTADATPEQRRAFLISLGQTPGVKTRRDPHFL